MTRKKPATIDFEAAIKDLNTIVEQLEQGGLTLEESLKKFGRGVELSQMCQQALKEAEQKVQILVQNNQNGTDEQLEPYESDTL